METRVNDVFSLGNSIFGDLKAFLLDTLGNVYPTLKIVKLSMIQTYPQVVFTQTRVVSGGSTTRNEIRNKNVEFELNIYATELTINGNTIDSLEIIEDIVNVSSTYLEKKFGSHNVLVTTGLKNFDSKNIASEKAIIQFNVKWLQDKNTYV